MDSVLKNYGFVQIGDIIRKVAKDIIDNPYFVESENEISDSDLVNFLRQNDDCKELLSDIFFYHATNNLPKYTEKISELREFYKGIDTEKQAVPVPF